MNFPASFPIGYKAPASSRILMTILGFIILAFAAVIGLLGNGCAIGMLNSLLDHKSFTASELTIRNKHNTTGKGATYWLETMSKAGDKYDGPFNLTVAPSFYRQASVNQHVCVHMHPDAFGLRWEDISQCGN